MELNQAEASDTKPETGLRRFDPLYLLRQAALNKENVPMIEGYLQLCGHQIHHAAKCAYQQRPPVGPFLDIGSIWFMWNEIGREDGTYEREKARRNGFTYLGVYDRNEILSFLEGIEESSKNIMEDVLYGRRRPRDDGTPKDAPPPPRAKKQRTDGGRTPVPAGTVAQEQLTYSEFTKRSRPMKGFDFMGRVPGRDLPDIAPILKLAEQELEHWNDAPAAPPPPTRWRKPFIQELEENLKQNPKDRPIILVPMNKNAPVNLLNVFQLLQEGSYAPPERGGAGGFGYFEALRKEVVEVVRTIDGKRWTFEVRDSTQHFNKGQWKRVVAVITDGYDWQFKGWPFASIVDLFCTVKGIYFRERDKTVEMPEHVTKWRVTTLELASTQLQHRFQALRDSFWKEVEGFMKSERQVAFSNEAQLDGKRKASDAKLRKPIL